MIPVDDEELKRIKSRASNGNGCECSSIVEVPVGPTGEINLLQKTNSAEIFFPGYATGSKFRVSSNVYISFLIFLLSDRDRKGD